MHRWIIVLLVLTAGCMGGQTDFQADSARQVGCAQDMKRCPDGSLVSRVEPGCQFAKCPPMPLKKMDLATDRPVYHSRENMLINLTVESDTGGIAEVYVHGINARNRERIRIRENYTLEDGINYVILKYRTPSCTGCSGIRPGDYTITAEVKMGDKNLEKNMTVNIQQ